MSLPRRLETEWLDQMEPDAPAAQRARRDLRLLNGIMGNAYMLRKRLLQHCPQPEAIVELGAGDGSLLLALVRGLPHKPRRVVLVDRHPAVALPVYEGLEALGCEVECNRSDVFDWLPSAPAADAIVCNLFLHHLAPEALRALLAACAEKTTLFLACEPARSRLALTASGMLGLIGCGPVTRHDAVASVHAGFRGKEISALWPGGPWQLEEGPAGLFGHVFCASRSGTL
jgi:hypothetical protein